MILSLMDPVTDQNAASLWETRVDPQTGRAIGSRHRLTNWAGSALVGLNASADGKQLAYLSGIVQADAFVGELEANGTRLKPPQRLTFDDRNDYPGAWTPDGKAILFTSDRNGNLDIFKQALDQRTAQAIIVGPDHECDPTVSPDGAWLLYFNLWTSARLTSSKPVRLMRVPLSGGSPQLLLDEQGVSFVRCSHLPTNPCVLSQRIGSEVGFYVLDPVQGKGRELGRMDLKPSIVDYRWNLSPDGSNVALITRAEREGRIRVLSLTSGASRDITVRGWGEFHSISWSVDGKGFYVASRVSLLPTLLYIDLEGRARVLRQTGLIDIFGLPSPDGRYLALAEYRLTGNAWIVENF